MYTKDSNELSELDELCCIFIDEQGATNHESSRTTVLVTAKNDFVG